MVCIYYGRAGCGKTYMLENEARRSLAEGRRVCLVVPEQLSITREYSFNAAGLKNIEVLSFTRLADTIFRTLGGTAKKLPDSAMSACAVYLALMRVYDSLTYYRRVAFSHGFVSGLLDAFAEFDTCCMSEKSIESIPDDKLPAAVKSKYHDLFLIYNEFKRLWNDEYKAPGDDLSVAAGLLELNDIFTDAVFLFDGFYGFTEQQLMLIEQLLRQAAGGYFAFTTDLEDDLFQTVTRECEKIAKLCKKCGIACAYVNAGNTAYRLETDSQRFLEKYLSGGSADEQYINDGNLTLYSAKNINDELNFIACKIKNDVLNGKYRYRDIAVLCPDSDAVASVASAAFSKQGVPLFADSKKSLLTKPLTAMVLCALEIVLRGMSFETVFAFLKTGLAGVSFDEISMLENYVRMWKIKGRSWLANAWTQNPSGLRGTDPDADAARLEKINEIKARALNPLAKFIEKIKHASSCTDMLRCVCALFDAYGVKEELENRALYFESVNERHISDEYRRIYEIFIGMLDSIAAVMGDTVLSAAQLSDIISISAGAISVSSRPACADEVVFSSLGRSRTEKIKCVYICRMNSGMIPALPSDTGLITDSDKRLFCAYSITTSMDFLQSALRERFDFYSAVMSASRELCLSWSLFEITGGSLLRSEYADRIAEITKVPELTSEDLPPEFYLVSLAGASSLAAGGRYPALMDIVKDISGFCARVREEDCRLSDEIVRGLYSENLRLSFSGIEEFLGCPFKFYIHRGLRARVSEPVEMNPANIGTFIHAGLERLLSGEFDLDGDISDITAKISDDYYRDELGDCKDSSCRFDWLFSRAKKAFEGAAKNVVEEIKTSDFVPYDFEIDISKFIPEIPLHGGCTLTLVGSIDRVDMMEKDNVRYAKIIDYKSGSQEFSLKKIYNGLSMQLPIYAGAVRSKFSNVRIAAMYYLRVGVPTVKYTDKSGMSDEKFNEKTNEFYKRDGIFSNAPEISGSLGRGIESLTSVKKDRLVDERVINSLIDFSVFKINETGNRIADGCADVSPIVMGAVSACDYCDYRNICKIDRCPQKVRVPEDPPEDFLRGEDS